MELRSLLYPLVCLLVYANHLCSASNPSPALRFFDERIGQEAACISSAGAVDLFEDGILYILEEYAQEEEHEDDNQTESKVFDQAGGALSGISSDLSDLFHSTHACIPSALSFKATTPPLYLLNQVFRI